MLHAECFLISLAKVSRVDMKSSTSNVYGGVCFGGLSFAHFSSRYCAKLLTSEISTQLAGLMPKEAREWLHAVNRSVTKRLIQLTM